MYNSNGDFGEVRLKSCSVLPEFENLDRMIMLGWHRCNHLYLIDRTNGIDSMLVMVTTDGIGNVILNGKHYYLRAGDVAVIPANTPHKYYVNEGDTWEFYWIHLTGNNCENIASLIISRYGYVFTDLKYKFHADNIEQLLIKPYRYLEYEIYSVHIISVILLSILSSQNDHNRIFNRKFSISEQVIKFIDNNYNHTISMSIICTHIHYSSEHIIRMFKLETGYTPYQYLKSVRIIKACDQLLSSDLQIKTIAKNVGYSSDKWFITQFKECKKMTPEVYRIKYGMS